MGAASEICNESNENVGEITESVLEATSKRLLPQERAVCSEVVLELYIHSIRAANLE